MTLFNFSSNLKKLRLSNNLTQKQLSEILNVSRQTISNYENSSNEPDFYMIAKIANYFNCSIDSLVFGGLNTNLYNIDSLLNIDNLLYDKKKIKQTLISNKKKLLKNIEEIDQLIDLINSLENSNNEFGKEFVYDINSKSKLNSSNLDNNNKIISFLDKLESKRCNQLIDCESNDYINEPKLKVNLLGQVSAGYPNFAYENRGTFVRVPNSLVCSSKDYFILQVSGDSMDKIYSPNELLLIERTPVANNGDMVIALIGTDECTLKEYNKTDNIIHLIPHSTNPVHKVQEYCSNKKPCHIIGVVKNILKGATLLHESI